MKRSDALAPLSRDHHVALVVAMTLSRADDSTAQAAAERFVAFLGQHELGHFALEESVLLPAVPDDARGRELAAQVRADHEYLRAKCRQLSARHEPPPAALLHEVGSRFRAHVQLEERQLFPYVEDSLDAPALDRLGARIAAARATGGHANPVDAVSRFLRAFIARDIDALIAAADPDIALKPLRLTGGPAGYRGHDGLRRWLGDLARLPAAPTFTLEDVHTLDREHAIAHVHVRAGDQEIAVTAVFTLASERVLEAHGYFSDDDTLSFVGVL
jgi:hypothetical protein